MKTLILGGARSGKSARAEEIALGERSRRVIYVATAELRDGDAELAARVAAHRSRRPAEWGTWEGSPADLVPFVASSRGCLLLVDCLTMLFTRMFFESGVAEDGSEEEWAREEIRIRDSFARLMASVPDDSDMVAVSNEVGMGIVPEGRLSRRFRDAQGRINRLCAAAADRVELVVAGIPLVIKDHAR